MEVYPSVYRSDILLLSARGDVLSAVFSMDKHSFSADLDEVGLSYYQAQFSILCTKSL